MRGQIAIGFLTVMALALVMVAMTVNVGEMAQVRVETSNAADAGALAGASWIASGMNEAALAANKINEAIQLVQLIYEVPFCPGEDQTRYAENLWYSLYAHPYAPDPVLGPPFVRRGPAQYFEEVANDAVWASWYVGNREVYTAIINNLMIKYDSGPMMTCSGLNWEQCLASHTNFGPISGTIKGHQESLNTVPKTGQDVPLSAPVQWNNRVPFDEPLDFTHKVPMTISYPERPPKLVLEKEAGHYHQYILAGSDEAQDIVVPGLAEPVFTCTFDSWGIRTGYRVGNQTALFVLMPDLLLNYSVNPLAMATGSQDVNGNWMPYWRKGWDVTWLKGPLLNPPNGLAGDQPYVPSIEHLDVGTCQNPDETPQYVCGTVVRDTSREPRVRPSEFNPADGGTVSLAVAHKVETATGTVGCGPSALPHLAPRFDAVGSKATARYIPPRFGFGIIDGKAVLEDAK